MLVIGQTVKLKDKSKMPEYFSDEGKVIKLHDKDKRVAWVEFELDYTDATYTLKLHESELEIE